MTEKIISEENIGLDNDQQDIATVTPNSEESIQPIDERLVLKKRVTQATIMHDKAVSIGSPVLLLIIFLEIAFAGNFYVTYVQEHVTDKPLRIIIATTLNLVESIALPIAEIIRTGSLVLFTIAIFVSLYYIKYRVPLKRARQALRDYEDVWLQQRMSTRKGWKVYIHEELRRLTYTISRVFIDNPNRFNQSKKWLMQASEILDKNDGELVEAQAMISSVNKLIITEEDELREQRNWRFFAVAIMICYISMLGIVFIFTNFLTLNQIPPSQDITFFGVPILIVIWGAIGSLAAILYRFYTAERRIHFDLEVRWLIARPIIGIIMGAMAYLALSSGLMLLSTQPEQVVIRQEVFWIVAFLAGFSDRFYMGTINLLVDKTIGNNDKDK